LTLPDLLREVVHLPAETVPPGGQVTEPLVQLGGLVQLDQELRRAASGHPGLDAREIRAQQADIDHRGEGSRAVRSAATSIAT